MFIKSTHDSNLFSILFINFVHSASKSNQHKPETIHRYRSVILAHKTQRGLFNTYITSVQWESLLKLHQDVKQRENKDDFKFD